MQYQAQPGECSLILEAGATKTAVARQAPTGAVARRQLPGLNANLQRTEQAAALLQAMPPGWLPQPVNQLWYYGAGLEPLERRSAWRQLLAEVFPQAKQIVVETDLLGAARALWGGEPGQAAILGTGSNYGYYDGQRLQLQLGGHGHLLGDEGSGADLGRRLLKGLLDARFASPLQERIQQALGASAAELKRWVYQQPLHNQALASLAPTVVELRQEPAVRVLIQEAFQAFLDTTALRNPSCQATPIGAVGSIAARLEPLWLEQLAANKLAAGPVLQHPLGALEVVHFFPA